MSGRNTTFAATFYHPILKTRVTRGLGVQSESAALRICQSLEVLCREQMIKSAAELEKRGLDTRAWLIFLKGMPFKVQGLPFLTDKPGLVGDVREAYPEMSDADITRIAPFVFTSKNAQRLVSSVPFINDFIKNLEKTNASPEAYGKFRTLLHAIADKLDYWIQFGQSADREAHENRQELKRLRVALNDATKQRK